MTIADIPAVDRALKKEFKAHAAPIIELIEAQTHDPFCVLVGTILSARTKDACTAGAVRRLFAAGKRRPRRFSTGEALAKPLSWCGETPHLRRGGVLSWCGETPHLRRGGVLSWCGETPHLRRGGVLASPGGRCFSCASENSLPPFSPSDLERLTVEKIEKLIYPVGFYRDKARHLKALPKVLQEKFGGVLPKTVEELCELPGVGRKTANLTVAVGFDLPAICVDVHVHRICNWLGLVKTSKPVETEMALRKILPVKYWKTWNSHLVSFGQTRCDPVRPKCDGCPIARYCHSPKKKL